MKNPPIKPIIIGTAGHIDHGKTALVQALTGIDADRLKEEKQRGITIDIGFAHLELPDPQGTVYRFGFVDVPGHERFVRNMLAGIGGIDLVLLVIAADESIMPQTREHFDICKLLSIRRGITVLTKSDLVDEETLEVVRMEVEEYLRDSFLDPQRSPVIPVSSFTGSGLDALKNALVQLSAEAPAKDSTQIARLPIDRVFLIKGFGTVVTGTLIAGSLHKEEEMEVFPGGRRVRVRGIQIHNHKVETAAAGQRTALNLAGVDAQDLARGMMLAPPGLFRSTHSVEVQLTLLPSARALPHRSRVHFYAYSGEVVAEAILHAEKSLLPGGTAYAQLRLAHPMLLLPGDRFIVRQLSPVITIGGGIVLDAALLPRRRKIPREDREAALKIFECGTHTEIAMARISRREREGMTRADIIAETGWRKEQTDSVLAQLAGSITVFGDRILTAIAAKTIKQEVVSLLNAYHDANPLSPGMPRAEIREKLRLHLAVFSATVDALVQEKKVGFNGDLVCITGRGVAMKEEEETAKKQLEQVFLNAGLQTPLLKDVLAGLSIDKARAQKILYLLLRDKILIKLEEDAVFHQSAIQELKRIISEYKKHSDRISIPRFKELAGITRRRAMTLIEYLDRERITRRDGEEHIIL